MTSCRPRGPWRGLLVVPIMLGLSACSGTNQGHTNTAEGRTNAQAAIVTAARAGGASEEQIGILTKSAAPSFEDYQTAINRSIACIEKAGIGTTDVRQVEQGITKLGYGYDAASPGRTNEQTDEIANACIRENNRWVENAWMGQPLAMEWGDQQIEKQRPTLIACLEANGVTVDQSLTTEEIRSRVLELARERGAAGGDNTLRCPGGVTISAGG
jgi:hypothetical protein